MFIETEDTPNPNSIKFFPGQEVIGKNNPLFFAKETSGSPLAKRLLELECIETILLGSDFVTVTKKSNSNWNNIEQEVVSILTDHFSKSLPIVEHNVEVDQINDDPVIQQICAVLNEKIRPAIGRDGGDEVFYSFSNGIVYLKLRGACLGCPNSILTLKSGIENMLKHYVPEVQEVKQVYDD